MIPWALFKLNSNFTCTIRGLLNYSVVQACCYVIQEEIFMDDKIEKKQRILGISYEKTRVSRLNKKKNP
jgi:hypothetical protein